MEHRGNATPVTMAQPTAIVKENAEPIYEKLAKDECLIIEKRSHELVVACNEGGRVRIKTVPLPK
jgi:hypothetical protein